MVLEARIFQRIAPTLDGEIALHDGHITVVHHEVVPDRSRRIERDRIDTSHAPCRIVILAHFIVAIDRCETVAIFIAVEPPSRHAEDFLSADVFRHEKFARNFAGFRIVHLDANEVRIEFKSEGAIQTEVNLITPVRHLPRCGRIAAGDEFELVIRDQDRTIGVKGCVVDPDQLFRSRE